MSNANRMIARRQEQTHAVRRIKNGVFEIAVRQHCTGSPWWRARFAELVESRRGA